MGASNLPVFLCALGVCVRLPFSRLRAPRRPRKAHAKIAPMRALLTLALLASACARTPPPRITLEPARLWADSYDTATLTVSPASTRPRLTLSGNAHIATAGPFHRDGLGWIATIRAGVLPGTVTLAIDVPNAPPAHRTLTTQLSDRDAAEDGTPDFLRLDTAASRAAFRHWFTFLAEAQYFQDPRARPPEIDDCAALIRYAYREALKAHDDIWAASARLPLIPAFDSPGKYFYPYTPLGANLFRTAAGPFRAADLSNAAFAQFADAKTLWRYNTHLVSRNLSRAEPGDLLFYRQIHTPARETYHSMIYLGPSQIQPGPQFYVIYHTGPQDASAGEMRRLTLDELRRFPEPEWRPDPENPSFLGVYRWNILKNIEVAP